MRRALFAPLTASVLVALVAASCGGRGATPGTNAAEQEAAWQSTIEARGLKPAGGAIQVRVAGGAPELSVTITVSPDAGRTYTFGDGLYGAEAYTYTGGAWVRVDTAEIRTEIAPLLAPGQSATVKLPVKEADSYRVVVKADGLAAWADSA